MPDYVTAAEVAAKSVRFVGRKAAEATAGLLDALFPASYVDRNVAAAAELFPQAL